jgi:glutamyl-tRNA synthetase
LILAVGPKPVDISLSWKNLYAYNRKIVDPIADRYFFVRDPIKLTVKNVLKSLRVQVPLHPDNPSNGSRSFEVASVNGEAHFLVSCDDTKILRNGKIVRLMSLFNICVEAVEEKNVQAVFHSESYTKAKTIKAPLIHWLPESNGIPCEVVMPDASAVTGVAEEACKTLSPNKIIQFERFGFVRVDDIDKTLTVYFAHR